MGTEKLRFSNAAGIELSGELDLPSEPPCAYAVFAHCFTCSANSLAAKRIGQALAQRGIATLRFDFTGLGSSGGAFVDSHFAANIDDLRAAADHLAATRVGPRLLIGHSLGGAAVIAAAEHIPTAAGVVTLGAPFDPGHSLHHFGSSLAEIEENGEAEVTLAGRTFIVGRAFLEGAQGHDQADRLAKLKRALLVMHAPTDEIVGIDNARAIFEAARHPKSFISLDSMDHLITDRSDSDYVAALIATWAGRMLEPAKAA